ncbi:MAG: hypothetical protein ACJ0BF_00910 [Gammaproteobacteria bacterium]|jgi:hypothetical protein
MTNSDRKEKLPGYFDSAWPVECGGNRRQKAATGKLLSKNSKTEMISTVSDKWNVMVIQREKNEFFLGGTMPYFNGPKPYGWVQKINSDSLEVLNESPQLPCGDHVWCGAIAAHENGSIIKVNGSFMHVLSPECEVILEKELPINQAHNGLLILSDGTIVTKDCRLENQQNSTITRLDPNTLELLHEPFALPEGSMGRIASDLNDDGEFIYIPGIERIWRIKVLPDALEIDEDWQPQYRNTNQSQGLAWDGCISEGSLWVMDNGDIESVRSIYGVNPNGRVDENTHLSWRNPAPWKGRQRLIKFDLISGEKTSIEPFDKEGGGIIAPPVNVPEYEMCIAWDSINGGLAGISTTDRKLAVSWQLDMRPTMQPVIFPESGELVINNFENGEDELIVVDIATGELLSRAKVNARLANGMFLTPGFNRDIFYCTTGTFSKVTWY